MRNDALWQGLLVLYEGLWRPWILECWLCEVWPAAQEQLSRMLILAPLMQVAVRSLLCFCSHAARRDCSRTRRK